jgi:hypothetical protein
VKRNPFPMVTSVSADHSETVCNSYCLRRRSYCDKRGLVISSYPDRDHEGHCGLRLPKVTTRLFYSDLSRTYPKRWEISAAPARIVAAMAGNFDVLRRTVGPETLMLPATT